ncbi:MAG: hypothetical protein E7617_00645 [Ruminococcaceae bacterium]|nr:hypothetical protein [Oscillospiraceae bacterium]
MTMQTMMNFDMNTSAMSSSCAKGAFCSDSSILSICGISLSVVAISAIFVIRLIIGRIIRIKSPYIIPG